MMCRSNQNEGERKKKLEIDRMLQKLLDNYSEEEWIVYHQCIYHFIHSFN